MKLADMDFKIAIVNILRNLQKKRKIMGKNKFQERYRKFKKKLNENPRSKKKSEIKLNCMFLINGIGTTV